MTEDEAQLDRIAKDLADGKVIDWEGSAQSNVKKSPLIDQLNAIEKISKAYGIHVKRNKSENATLKASVLFKWGHLHVLEKIGEGSFGEVFRAYDSVLDRDVALKLLKQERLAPVQSRAFIQEARRLAKIRNRHVLAIHGANVNDGRVGIWSDLIDGINLAEVQLKRSPGMPIDSQQLVTLINAMADALAAVHDAGLIHGDIKPSNVMVDARNQFTLMDFGAGMEYATSTTQSGYLIGTILYMAPELFKENELNPASDIYAMGVLLFNWVTGSHPVKGKDLLAIRQAHATGKYASIRQFQPKFPKQLTHLIQQMLLADPKDRPTAVEIKNQLHWITTAPQRRNKRLALSLIGGLLVSGTLISSVGFYRANQAQQVAIQEKEKAEVVSEFMKDILKAPNSQGKGRNISVADLLVTAAEEATEKFVAQPHTRAAIFQAIGGSYSSLQRNDEALKYYSESLSIQQQINGEKSPEILPALIGAAEQNRRLRHFTKSKAQLLKAIDIADTNQATHSFVLAHIRLAEIVSAEGNFQQAESSLLQLLEDMPDEKNPANNNRFLIFRILADNYLDQSNYAQAEDAGKQGLAWLAAHYADKADINVYGVKTVIAIALSQQGKFVEAESYFRALTEDAKILFGEKNQGYIQSLINLGTVLQDQGEFNQALMMLEQALNLSKEIDTGESFIALNIRNNMANLKSAMQDFSGAEQMMRETLTRAIDFLGHEHRMVLMIEVNLTEILNLSGKYKQAGLLAETSGQKMQQVLGEAHLYTLLQFDQLAISLAAQNDLLAAEKMQREVLTKFQQGKLNQTPEMTQVYSHLIDTLLLAEKNTEAHKKLLLLIEMQHEILGPNHPDVEKTKQKLSMLEAQSTFN